MPKTAPRPDQRRLLLPLLAFLALAVVWTWPLALYARSRIPHDLGDPLLNTWIVWWNAHQVPFTEAWWSPPIFYPMRGALALSEHLAGLGLITTPVQLAGGSAVLAYNIALILSYALSGFFAFVLVQRLTGSTMAATCGGAAYALAPYRSDHLPHIQVLTSQWMPLALLSLHAYLESRRPRWLLVFAVAWLLQSLSNGYYLLFFPVMIGMWLLWFVPWRADPRPGLAALATWIAASLLLVPVLLKYVDVHHALGLERTVEEIRRFSAEPVSFLHAPPMLAFWSAPETDTAEDYLFPGITAVLLVFTSLAVVPPRGLRRAIRRRSALLFYTAATVLLWLLTLGPAAPQDGWRALFHPYTPLMWLPGFHGLRVPARFAMLASLSLAVAAGIAMARLAPALGKGRSIFLAMVLAGLTIDGWMKPLALLPAPGRLLLDLPPQVSLIVLPVDDPETSVSAMFRAMYERRPLVNGYSGYAPPHYRILGSALRAGDTSVLDLLARGRPLAIIVNHDRDPGGMFSRLVEALPGVSRMEGSSAGIAYVLPARPQPREPETGVVYSARAEEQPREHVMFDLGSVKIVRLVEFPLRWHYEEMGSRFAIEVSVDGQHWSTVWEDWTGAPALAGALRDQRLVPVRLTVPDVPARYVRVHPAPAWLYRELTISGPR